MREQNRKIWINCFRAILLTIAFFVNVVVIERGLAAGDEEICLEEFLGSGSFSDDGSPDSEELYEGYLNQLFYGRQIPSGLMRAKTTIRSRLSGQNAAIYDTILPKATEIANGEETEAEFKTYYSALGIETGRYLTAADVGVDTLLGVDGKLTAEAEKKLFTFDARTIIQSLITDCPYDFYWFAKTRGYAFGKTVYNVDIANDAVVFPDDSYVVFRLIVDPAYRSTAAGADKFTADPEKTGMAAGAAEYAHTIVSNCSSLGDYAKLIAYKDVICRLVTYDDDAAHSGSINAGTDPWQLIYVFDRDSSTNVVCEGYSKAFQYLCDLTTFSDGSLESHIVIGLFGTGTEPDDDDGGGHMWNIVTIDHINYLADVTNSDAGTIGYRGGELFLGGANGSADSYYIVNCGNSGVWYKYYEDSTRVYYTKEELTLSSTPYELQHTTHTSLTSYPAIAPACTEEGNIEYWICSGCGKCFSDEECTTEISYSDRIRQALGHSLTAIPAVEATCTASGNTTYWKCSRCNKHFSDAAGTAEFAENSWVINAPGHSLTAIPAVEATCTANGNTAYWKCSRCNKYFSDAAGTIEIAENSWVVNAPGHGLTAMPAAEATCTAKGNMAYWKCSRCNKYFSDAAGTTEIADNSWETASLGHNMTKTEATAATCITSGNSEYWHCDRCGKYFSDAAGTTEIAENSWVINAKGHTEEDIPAVPATCASTGLTAGRKCSVCGTVIVGQTDIPATGHAYGNVWIKADDVNHRRVCANDANHAETAPHTWDSGRVTTAPTAEEKGVKTYTCTACGAVYTEAVDNSAEKAAAAAAAKEAADREVAEAAIAEMNALPADPTADDKALTEEVRTVYEALTSEQKALVPAETVAKLVEAESQVKAAAEKISAVPAVNNLTEEDEKVIKEALAAYEALSEAEKALVPEETVKKLTEAEARITVLKAESKDSASAKNVEKTLTSRASDSDPKGSSFAPLKTKVLAAQNKSLTISWTKVKGAKSYILYGNACGKSNKMARLTKTTGNKVVVKKIKNRALKKGTYYKFIVVACRQENGYDKTIATSKVIHACTTGGKYTNPKKVTVNASKVTVKKGKRYTIETKQVLANSKLLMKTHRALCCESSNPKVATVTKRGVVKGIAKGTAIIYVYSQNGACASVKITVN